MRRSTTAHPGSSAERWARNSRADEYVLVEKPLARKSHDSVIRKESSSSTICTVGSIISVSARRFALRSNDDAAVVLLSDARFAVMNDYVEHR
jgi:hypothetical protein